MSEPYCQFPICALAFGIDVQERLQVILGYSAAQIGLELWGKYTVEQLEHFRANPPEWCTRRLRNDMYLPIAIGCEELGIIPPDLRSVADDYSDLADFADHWERRHGPDAKVRLAVHFVLEAIEGKSISYPELSVLAAIYSRIGSKQGPVRITREEIWRRSLGYKSERVFKEETGGSGFCRTARQVRSIIERLAERNFFARITFANRETYYSHRLSLKDLADQIYAKKVYHGRARQARIAANAELTRKIQAERRRLAGGNAADGATDAPL